MGQPGGRPPISIKSASYQPRIKPASHEPWSYLPRNQKQCNALACRRQTSGQPCIPSPSPPHPSPSLHLPLNPLPLILSPPSLPLPPPHPSTRGAGCGVSFTKPEARAPRRRGGILLAALRPGRPRARLALRVQAAQGAEGGSGWSGWWQLPLRSHAQLRSGLGAEHAWGPAGGPSHHAGGLKLGWRTWSCAGAA